MRKYDNVLLDPSKATVLIIDHQPQMYFGFESSDRSLIENNVLGLAKAANVFKVPCILTTVAAESFSGPLYSKLRDIYPDVKPIDRTSINCWEDANVHKAVESTGRKKLILSGLWTEACVLFPALSMLSDGYEVYVVTDACGGVSKEAHETAILRMTRQGAVPVTWLQVMLEFQRDWNNKDTYDQVMGVIKEHAGAYGLGVEYAEAMVQA
ncbi:MAG: hydrolase [Clostridiales bacterium]|nr:hydrolase [Clostridiales bacterium]